MSLQVLRSRPVGVTLFIIAALILHEAWSHASGARKLTNEKIAMAEKNSGSADRLDLRIVLAFRPEQFHFLWLQNFGRMSGADERSIVLRGVATADAKFLARKYWIVDLKPLGSK